jgi:hypothetical protein
MTKNGRRRAPFYACTYNVKRGRTICRNTTVVRQEVIERAFLDALAAALDARMIEGAVREALVTRRRDGDQRLGQRGQLERERSLVEARTRHILNAVGAGFATTPLLQALEREEARKDAIATELARLADFERVASLDAAQVSRTLSALATERAGCSGRGAGTGPPDAPQPLRRAPHRVPAHRRPAGRHAGLSLSGGGQLRGAADRAGGY